MELSSPEERLSTLLQLSRDAYASAHDPDQWPAFLNKLANRFDSGAAAIIATDCRTDEHLYSVAGGLPEQEWAAYVSRTLPRDPTLELLRTQPELACIQDGPQPRSTEATAARREPTRWRSVLGARLHRDEERSLCALVLRDVPRGPFTDCALRDFRHMAPTLRDAALMCEQSLARSATRQAIDSTLDYLPTAVLVLDIHANVLYRNAAANRLVNGSNAVRVQEGRLRLARQGDQRTLYARVRDVLESGRQRRLIRFGNGRSALTALAAPMAPPSPPFCRNAAAALVMIWSAELSSLCCSALRETFGLSRREAELAAQIAQGTSLSGVAEAMGIKRSTARVHLENILNKTGTHRQTELVALLRSSSAITPAFESPQRAG